MANLEIPIKIDTGFLIKVVRSVTASPEFNETTSDDYKKGFFDFADALINTLEKISRNSTAEEARCDSCKGMTPQEAIRRIKNHNEVHSRKEQHFAVHITEALNMACDALEKQIPKKLLHIGIEQCCPVCKDGICLINDDGCYGNYCAGCGQGLDWSDTECQITRL